MNQCYVNKLGRRHQVVRMLWGVVWAIGAKWLPRSVGSGWKRVLLRLFGAKIADTAVVYSSVSIYWPANLIMGEYSCLADGVNCYNVGQVVVEAYATVSQDATLCTASHDITSPTHELIVAPIKIERQAWVAAEAFVGMGVTVGEGAVVGARGVAVKDVEPWMIVVGNPACAVKKRTMKTAATLN